MKRMKLFDFLFLAFLAIFCCVPLHSWCSKNFLKNRFAFPFLLSAFYWMHPDYERAHRWSRQVIGGAIEVHRLKGPGLLESIYEKCLLRELGLLINFHEMVLKNGIHRLILSGADKAD